jgi:hypothetical protein
LIAVVPGYFLLFPFLATVHEDPPMWIVLMLSGMAYILFFYAVFRFFGRRLTRRINR